MTIDEPIQLKLKKNITTLPLSDENGSLYQMKQINDIMKKNNKSRRGPVIKVSQEYKSFHTRSFEISNAL